MTATEKAKELLRLANDINMMAFDRGFLFDENDVPERLFSALRDVARRARNEAKRVLKKDGIIIETMPWSEIKDHGGLAGFESEGMHIFGQTDKAEFLVWRD